MRARDRLLATERAAKSTPPPTFRRRAANDDADPFAPFVDAMVRFIVEELDRPSPDSAPSCPPPEPLP